MWVHPDLISACPTSAPASNSPESHPHSGTSDIGTPPRPEDPERQVTPHLPSPGNQTTDTSHPTCLSAYSPCDGTLSRRACP